MAYEIIVKKRFTNKLLGVLDYLEKEWGIQVAIEFLGKVQTRINALKAHPYIGAQTSLVNVRSTLITKHNRLFYRVNKDKIVILNLYDTRRKNRNKLRN